MVDLNTAPVHPLVGRKVFNKCEVCDRTELRVKQIIDTTAVLECKRCDAQLNMHTITMKLTDPEEVMNGVKPDKGGTNRLVAKKGSRRKRRR